MKTKAFIIPLIFIAYLLFVTGCKKKTSSTSFSIGQAYGGGKIFYIDNTGQHGLIASSSDQSSGIQWFNGDYVATNATSSSDGSANTIKIINIQGTTGSYAARLCKDYNEGGFSDWFLPSKDELNLLYNQNALIGNFTQFSGFWSSTEFDNNDAWVQSFRDGSQGNSNKLNSHSVRAIRKF